MSPGKETCSIDIRQTAIYFLDHIQCSFNSCFKVNNLSLKMRSHRFINSLLCLVIQLVGKESNAKENNAGIRRFFVLFLEKRYISHVIHFDVEDVRPSVITLSDDLSWQRFF